MKSGNLTVARRVAALLLFPALLLVFASSAYAQVKVTASPASITDTAKPSAVVLHVTKSDNTAVDQTFNAQLGSVKVGNTTVPHQFDAAKSDITITPPPGLNGAQKVQVLDKSNQLLAETQLQYPAASSGAGSSGSGSDGSAAAATSERDENRKDELMRSPWYRGIVMALFAALLIPFVYTLYRVIRFSGSSFRNPLGFPIGSFRAMLAFTLVAYLGFYVLSSVLSISTFQPPQFLLGVVATVIGFYFGSRGSEEAADRAAGAARAGTVDGTVTNADKSPAVGANVVLSQGAVKKPAITDLNGKYKFENVPFGEYTIVATSGNATSEAKKLTVAAAPQTINLELKS